MIVVPGDDAMWATVFKGRTREVVRIDPVSNEVRTVVGGLPEAQIASVGVDGVVWVADWDRSSVTGYDAQTGEEVARLAVGLNPIEPVAAYGDVWTLDHHGGTVTRIDTETRAVQGTIAVGTPGERGPNSMSAGGDLLWVVSPNAPEIVAIDPATNAVARRHPLPQTECMRAVSYIAERVWTMECDLPRVHVFDPESGQRLGSLDAMEVPVDIRGEPWVLTRLRGRPGIGVAKVDPESLQVGDVLRTGVAGVPLLISAFDSLWIVAGLELTRVPHVGIADGG